jgi:hypothetical protein
MFGVPGDNSMQNIQKILSGEMTLPDNKSTILNATVNDKQLYSEATCL